MNPCNISSTLVFVVDDRKARIVNNVMTACQETQT
jgi:hypothetical protein